MCAGNSVFWTDVKQFWAWVQDGMVTYLNDNPLTGKFEGRREKLLILVNHVVLDKSVPEHKDEVMGAYEYRKLRRPQYPKPAVKKRRSRN